jgi:hypothetical protein
LDSVPVITAVDVVKVIVMTTVIAKAISNAISETRARDLRYQAVLEAREL